MDNVITLNYNKPQTYEFQLTIQGLDSQDVRVFMGIETKEITLCFKAERKEGDNWTVPVPALKSMLEPSAYPFYIAAVIDGYFFEPLKGTCNVSKGPEIYVKKSDAKLEPAKAVETPEETKDDKKTTEKRDKKVDNKSKHPITVHDDIRKQQADESADEAAARLLKEDKKPGKKLDLNTVVEEALAGTKSKKRTPVKEGKKDDKIKQILAEAGVPERKEEGLVAELAPVIEKKVEEVVAESIEVTEDEQAAKARVVLNEMGIKTRKSRKKFKLGIEA